MIQYNMETVNHVAHALIHTTQLNVVKKEIHFAKHV